MRFAYVSVIYAVNAFTATRKVSFLTNFQSR